MPNLSNDGLGDPSSAAAPQKMYINRETVSRIEDHTGTRMDWMREDWDIPDLHVELFYDIGQDWQPSIEVYGSYDTDPEGRITGWGSAFLVGELFDKLGIDFEINDDGTLPRFAFEQAPGTDFYMLRYVVDEGPDGLQYGTYGRIETTPERSEALADEEAAKAALEDQFLYSVQQGYVDDYRPQLIDEEQDDPGQPTASQPAGVSNGGMGSGDGSPPEDDTFEPDDELPF